MDIKNAMPSTFIFVIATWQRQIKPKDRSASDPLLRFSLLSWKCKRKVRKKIFFILSCADDAPEPLMHKFSQGNHADDLYWVLKHSTYNLSVGSLRHGRFLCMFYVWPLHLSKGLFKQKTWRVGPKSSAVGPVVSTLYTNDWLHGVSRVAVLFADDVKIWQTNDSPSNVQSLQNDIDRISTLASEGQ